MIHALRRSFNPKCLVSTVLCMLPAILSLRRGSKVIHSNSPFSRKIHSSKMLGGPELPAVGLGTMGISDGGAIRTAVAAGYRLIDCAPVYFNEALVGDALTEVFETGTVRRQDLFVTSKLASPFHRREHVEIALRKTLTDLRLDYLDMFLIHWPVAFKYVEIDPTVRGWENEDIDDSDGGKQIDPAVSVHETWMAMEEMVDKGLTRHIGVSNFPVALIHELLTGCRIKPAVNQVEVHPYMQQQKLIDYCSKRGIKVQAYSPLGTSGYKEANEPSVLSDEVLREMASAKGVTVAQLCVSWALQRGTSIIAKSSSAERQKENLRALQNPIILSEEERKAIDSLDRGYRFFRPEDWWGDMAMAVFH